MVVLAVLYLSRFAAYSETFPVSTTHITRKRIQMLGTFL